eukprot:8221295-Lingulodinium_polyedra.AAC.1
MAVIDGPTPTATVVAAKDVLDCALLADTFFAGIKRTPDAPLLDATTDAADALVDATTSARSQSGQMADNLPFDAPPLQRLLQSWTALGVVRLCRLLGLHNPSSPGLTHTPSSSEWAVLILVLCHFAADE